MAEAMTYAHEAGHCVVARALGHHIDSVTVIPTDGAAGCTTGEGTASDMHLSLIGFAGMAAERRLLRTMAGFKRIPMWLEADIADRASYDLERVADIWGGQLNAVISQSGKRSVTVRDALQHQAAGLVRRNWDDIVSLAHRLQDEGTVHF